MTTFMGHDMSYWIELKRQVRAEGISTERLIQEIADLRAKVSFYESRIEEMDRFRKQAKGD